jgi:hypothetical protein
MVIGSSHTIDSYEIPTRPEPTIPEHVPFGIFDLVHRLTYNSDVAAGQLAVFQGASDEHI